MSNATLGTIDCPTCGKAGADVRQSRRRGAHLYYQCADCGLNQGTGPALQRKLWAGTEWRAGVQPIRPANVTAEAATTEPLAEFDPSEPEPATEPQADATPAPQPKPARALGIFALAAVALGAYLAT